MTERAMHRGLRTAVFIVIAALFGAAASAWGADYANPDLLVEAGMVADKIGQPDWVVIDCRDEKAYAAGHIPGAINLKGACGKVLRNSTFRARKTEDLESLLGGAGFSMDKHVVVYADAPLITSASVAFWILEYLGHEKVHFLNGGIEAWQETGRPVDRAESRLRPDSFKSRGMKSRIATTGEVVSIARGEIKNTNLIDARTEKEHKGDDIRALRGGYIPTAVLLPHTHYYDVRTGRIHKMDELMGEKLFGRIDRDRRSIAYCQTGTRSTVAYLVMRLMGFRDPANYDDSWIVYGSNVNYPAANENWFDFVKVNEAMKELEDLKKEIEQFKGKMIIPEE